MNSRTGFKLTKAEHQVINSVVDSETELTEEQAEEMFATLIWAHIVEPGDGVAGALLDLLKPIKALRVLVEKDLSFAGKDESLGQMVRLGMERWLPRLERETIFKQITAAANLGLKFLTPVSKNWPAALADLAQNVPIGIWAQGNLSLLAKPQAALVGARASTRYGEDVTFEFAHSINSLNFNVASGGAYGIDAAAHRAAMKAGGKTVVVLAGGLDRLYPSGNKALFERVLASDGVLCSEMSVGGAPTRWRFLQRNRILAAISNFTLVLEAGSRSGSINTAGHAAHLGRPLGAVPGPITSPSSMGCHKIIKEYGALLVSNEADIKELAGLTEENSFLGFGDERELSKHSRILDALPLRGARSTEQLAKLAGLPLREVQYSLNELEILGRVTCSFRADHEKSMWKRVP